MNKEVSKKMKIIMRKNGSLVTCGIYESLAAILIGLSTLTERISLPATSFCLYTLMTVGINYIKALEELKKDKYKEEHLEEYNELEKIYNEYLDSIVDIIKQYEYEDDLQLLIILDYLLYTGIFSYNNKYEYKNFEEVNEHFRELIGTFVFTGYGVCRHNTLFILDILKKLDKKCFEVLCSSDGKKANHDVVGIVSNGEKYIYDFTNHYCGEINGKNIYAYPLGEKLYKITKVLINNKEYKKYPERKIDTDLVMKYINKMDDYDYNLIFQMFIFSRQNDEIKKDISEKTLKLMPRK